MTLRYSARRWALKAAALSCLVALGACEKAPPAPKFKNLDITGAEYARQIELPNAEGQPFRLSSLKGKVAVVFFGYTQCPDVCPTTLSSLVETQKLLGVDGDKLVGVFVTVDPKRDTPELLKSYIGSFNPNWVALRGTADETATTAREFKVFYREVPGKTETSYTVDHTAASFVFDTEGKVRLYVRHATPPADLAADIKLLLGQR